MKLNIRTLLLASVVALGSTAMANPAAPIGDTHAVVYLEDYISGIQATPGVVAIPVVNPLPASPLVQTDLDFEIDFNALVAPIPLVPTEELVLFAQIGTVSMILERIDSQNFPTERFDVSIGISQYDATYYLLALGVADPANLCIQDFDVLDEFRTLGSNNPRGGMPRGAAQPGSVISDYLPRMHAFNANEFEDHYFAIVIRPTGGAPVDDCSLEISAIAVP